MSVAGRQRAGRRPSRAAGAQTRAALGAAPVRAPATQAAAPAFALPQLQRKLAVGRSDSPFESEADQVADSVLTGKPAPAVTPLPTTGLGPAAQRSATEAEEDEVQASEIEAAEEEPLQAQTTEEVEEEDPVQAEMEDEEPVMAQAEEEEEEPIQMQMQMEDEEQEPVQAKSTGSRARDRGAVEQAIRAPGSGRALPGDVRNRIETSIGADLSDVRVHDDADAARAARGIGARAFAHGRDIWLGPGESARDTRLIAHEAAHVVQQTGRQAAPGRGASPSGPAPARPLVQRATDGVAGDPPGISTANGSVLDIPSGTLEIPKLDLPKIANGDQVPFPAKASKPGERETNQRLIWLQEMKLDEDGIRRATPDDKAVNLDPGGRTWFLRLGRSKRFLVGTRESLKTAARLPNWRKNGVAENLQVDHIHEDQLGGDDKLPNFQLLDRKTNLAKGKAIRDSIRKSIGNAMKAHRAKHPKPRGGEIDHYAKVRGKRPDQIRGLLNVIFKEKGGTISVSAPEHIWTVKQVKTGEHLAELTPTNDASIVPPLGSDVELVILTGEAGNYPVRVPIKDGKPQVKVPSLFFAGINNLIVVGMQYSPGSLALEANFVVKGKVVQDIKAPMKLANLGNPYTFQMPTDLMQTGFEKRLTMPKASPVTVSAAAISGGQLEVQGQLDFSSRLFKGASADLTIRGEDVALSRTFTGGEFDLPGPIDVTGSSLTISIGTTQGKPNLSLAGEVEFEARRIGKGVLRGMGGLVEGVAVEGEFDFDPTLFRGADARIKVGYAKDKLSGEGTLKIGDGQIRGIRSAELSVTVEDKAWEATGTVVPKIPGVTEGTLAMSFDPDGGFALSGELTLGEGIPRLKSGKLSAKLVKAEDAWKVSASGEAALDIPGVDAKLKASYDDGKFRAEANLAYARGIASGRATVGATNMPVDPETGSFTEGEPTETVTIYGAGEVTIRFTPWLQGTARLKLLPDGSMEVTGRVALPDTLEVFPEKKLERQLISIGVDIPVFGVAVAGQRIGIFLNINGALTAKASIGPGELRNVAVEVTYNPEDENTTRVSGSARFVVPAEAGLRLAIQGAIGAGIPVVSARAGLEIGGELGISGEATAGAEVEWTPSNGLSMEADVGVSAAPKFTFDIAGFVDVSADLLLTKIELYSKRWQLASFEYGSGMQVGASLTVRIENNELQPISMDDVDLTVPDIDPVGLARGLIGKVV